MKLQKLLFILTFMVLNTGNIFAQNNELKAKIEYEDAETAFQNGDYNKTIAHLDKARTFLGFWTSKISYLKIISTDKIIKYGHWDNQFDELKQEITKYMKYANENSDKADLEKSKRNLCYRRKSERSMGMEKIP